MSSFELRYRTANVENNARLDVAASGLCGSRFERTLLDVRVFNPYAGGNSAMTPEMERSSVRTS